MAALALASDPPTEEILDRKPAKRTAPLISIIMWKMVIGQAIYQMVVTFILYYVGPSILNYPYDGKEIRSVVFNTFVWFQIFNMLNNRRLDNKFNVFVGAHRNYFFIAIAAIMIGCQVMIMYVGGRAFSINRIDAKDWGISIVLALLCLPWAILVRLFPDAWFEAAAKFCGWPVVQIYRPLSRWSHAASRKIRGLRRSKKESETVAAESESEEKATAAADQAKMPQGSMV
jgi:Ca2+-transporting ATPase